MKRKMVKKHSTQSAVPISPLQNWPKIRWIVMGLVTLMVGGICAIVVMQTPRKLAESDVRFLHTYEQVRIALADDNLEGAKAAAKPIEMESEPLSSAAMRLIASGTLDSARNEFKVLSDHAVMLAADQPNFFIMQCITPCPLHCTQCPMEHFGKWVQQTPEVANPYMGSSGLACGRISNL